MQCLQKKTGKKKMQIAHTKKKNENESWNSEGNTI